MEPNIEKPFKCIFCEARFKRKPYLEAHVRTHTGEKPFECDVCSKRYTQKSSLNTHKKSHTGERPFSCDVCEKRFAVKSYLTSHRRSHIIEKPLESERYNANPAVTYECNVCMRTFLREAFLKTHINQVHPKSTSNNNNSSNHSEPDVLESSDTNTTGANLEITVCEVRYGAPELDNLGRPKLSIIAEEIAKFIKESSLQ